MILKNSNLPPPFEHDSYNDGNDVRDASREYLESFGYVLIADNFR